MRDALKNYLALANGLTEVTRQRAEAAARALVAQGEAAAEQVRPLAEDLVNASRANRENLAALVRTEVDKALGRMGIVTAEEVARLQRRLQTVESTMRGVGATTSAFATTARKAAASRRPVKSGGGAAAPGKAAGRAASKPASKATAKPAATSTATRAKSTPPAAQAAKPAKPTAATTATKATKATKAPTTKTSKTTKASPRNPATP